MRWTEVNMPPYGDESPHVIFYFDKESDAKEFLRHAKICKDVDDELLFYGDGVLRTIKRGQNGKKSVQAKSVRAFPKKHMR